MLVVFLSIFVADAKIVFSYNFISPVNNPVAILGEKLF